MAGETKRADCLHCRAFYITYEAEFPYGCRSFAMKSKTMPAIEVRRASGQECKAFEPKYTKKKSPRRPDDDKRYA